MKGDTEIFRKLFMDRVGLKLGTSGRIVIDWIKEKGEYVSVSWWERTFLNKAKFRSRISTDWYKLVKSAELMIKVYTGKNVGIRYRLWNRCTQLRGLNTRKEVTGVPEEGCDNHESDVPEIFTGCWCGDTSAWNDTGGSEAGWGALSVIQMLCDQKSDQGGSNGYAKKGVDMRCITMARFN